MNGTEKDSGMVESIVVSRFSKISVNSDELDDMLSRIPTTISWLTSGILELTLGLSCPPFGQPPSSVSSMFMVSR